MSFSSQRDSESMRERLTYRHAAHLKGKWERKSKTIIDLYSKTCLKPHPKSPCKDTVSKTLSQFLRWQPETKFPY